MAHSVGPFCPTPVEWAAAAAISLYLPTSSAFCASCDYRQLNLQPASVGTMLGIPKQGYQAVVLMVSGLWFMCRKYMAQT